MAAPRGVGDADGRGSGRGRLRVLLLFATARHVAVPPEARAFGDDHAGGPDVARQLARGLDLHALAGVAVACQLTAHHDGLGVHVRPHAAAGPHAEVAGDVDLSLDHALDDDVFLARDLSLDDRLRADHAGGTGGRRARRGTG